jgi:hypothetical protein
MIPPIDEAGAFAAQMSGDADVQLAASVPRYSLRRRSGARKIDIVDIDGGKAKIQMIKDGFKFTPTAVTVTGDTVWVREAKFAYRNDPALKDKDPDPFDATAVTLTKR